MIPQAYITQWQQYAPWPDNNMIEQDLVISRALIDLFQEPELRDSLAFRGGTALFKLYLPAARYSEDIDLVQIKPGPMGHLMDKVRSALSPWLGQPKWKQTKGRVTFKYRFISEENVPLNLKLEINSREHFSVYGFQQNNLVVNSSWYSGTAEVTTYTLEELLATKLRALYQRKKGRDLFDLFYAFDSKKDKVNVKKIIEAFQVYMRQSDQNITRAMFEMNMHEKYHDAQFTGDIRPLLHPDINWNFDEAYSYVMKGLISNLSGDPWIRSESIDT